MAMKRMHTKHHLLWLMCEGATMLGFKVWKAQTEPLKLDEDQTRSFLDENVNVYKQTREARANGTISVVFSSYRSVPRITFLKLWILWFAIAIGGVTLIPTLIPDDNDVMEAVKYVTTNYPTVKAFDAAYYKHAFDKPGDNLDLGFYAKDNAISPFLKVSAMG